jgi:hypothetical protein
MSDSTDIVDYYAALAAQHGGKCVYHAPAEPPSPLAEAVVQAVALHVYDVPAEGCPNLVREIKRIVPPAIREVARQMSMEEPLGDTDSDQVVFAVHHAVVAELLALADDLQFKVKLPPN